ncbi:MAG: hypothetical protein ACFFB3_08640 [Candidatus Hodarchaeota archaeon]
MNASSDFWCLFDRKSPIVVYGHPGTGRSTFLMSFAVHNVKNNSQKRSALVDCSSRLTINRLRQIAKDSAILKQILVFQPVSSWNLLEIIDDIDLLSQTPPQILIDNPFWNAKPQDLRYLSYVFSKLRELFENSSSPSVTVIAVNAQRTKNRLVPQQRAILERYFDNRVLLEKNKRKYWATINFGSEESLEFELRMTETGLSIFEGDDFDD